MSYLSPYPSGQPGESSPRAFLSDAEYVSLPRDQFSPLIGAYYWVRLKGFPPEICRVARWTEGRFLFHTTRSMAFIATPGTECEVFGPLPVPKVLDRDSAP